ncbi:MAG: hypothetical protein ABIZ09_06595 [Rhodoferax sp.]
MSKLSTETQKSERFAKRFMGAIVLCLLGIVAVPWALEKLYGPLPKPTPLGAVQRVRFVGGLGLYTQIDTAAASYLVHGAMAIRPGANLEQHQTYFETQLCDVQSQDCRELASH